MADTAASEYRPVLVTNSEGEIVGAIIDADALAAARPALDELQALRDAGHQAAPAAWLQMRSAMLADGYAREACAAE